MEARTVKSHLKTILMLQPSRYEDHIFMYHFSSYPIN